MDIGNIQLLLSAALSRRFLLSVIILIACVITARLVARGPSLERKLLLGLVLLTFFASQGLSILDAYRNTGLYHRRNTMALSDLQVLEINFDGTLFGGKRVLPL